MSGHSKWASIKHKKGVVDAKRGKAFTKLIKELTVAARMGGADANFNPRLRTAIAAAKAANMPKDNIDRAVKKGSGDMEGFHYEEVIYEGYGPAGVALIVEVLTDNRNRTVADIRYILSRNSGRLGEAGCVSYMFEKRGIISIDKDGLDEDTLMGAALDAGAIDVIDEGSTLDVITEATDFETVRETLEGKGFSISTAMVTMLPKNSIAVTGKDAERTLRLMDALEDNEDVQNVYANFDISEEVMEGLNI
jgi:YebC/PmpR family DNA-binding regulatory protein